MLAVGAPLVSSLTLLLLTLAVVEVSAQKAPRFKACKRNQPPAKLNECVRDSLQNAVPELVKGLPEYGLFSIDPLHIKSVDVLKNNRGKVSVDISFKNLDIFGLGNAKIKSVDIDVEKRRMTSKIHIDGNINLIADYDVNGKVLVLPIQGSGKCNITIINPKGELTELQATPVSRDGKEFAHVTSLKFVINEVDRVYFDLKNLFKGNKELGDNMNLVLNDNWKEIYEDMVGPVQLAIAEAFKSEVENLLKRVPYKKIFP